MSKDISRMLEAAIRLALEAHTGQVDKGGTPYILHPLRLMLRFRDPIRQIVAVLHDVLEDGKGINEERLRQEGFSEEIIEAVKALSRNEDESYMAFIDRCGANAIALEVKLEDLDENLDTSRLTSIGDEDLKRLAKYRKAQERLRRRQSELAALAG